MKPNSFATHCNWMPLVCTLFSWATKFWYSILCMIQSFQLWNNHFITAYCSFIYINPYNNRKTEMSYVGNLENNRSVFPEMRQHINVQFVALFFKWTSNEEVCVVISYAKDIGMWELLYIWHKRWITSLFLRSFP